MNELFEEIQAFLNEQHETSDEVQEYNKLLSEFYHVPSYVGRFKKESTMARQKIPYSMLNNDAGKLSEYMDRHKNTRTGEVTLDRDKIMEETSMSEEQINRAIGSLDRQRPRRWGFCE